MNYFLSYDQLDHRVYKSMKASVEGYRRWYGSPNSLRAQKAIALDTTNALDTTKYLVKRTEMCGGGTRYDVYSFEKSPATNNTVSLPHLNFTGCHVYESLITPEMLKMKPYSYERFEAFSNVYKKARSIELAAIKKAFPEAKNWKEVPQLWINETYTSEHKVVELTF